MSAENDVAMNQVGFATEAPKFMAFVDAGPASFQVLDAEGHLILKGSLGEALEWDGDGACSRSLDWSAVHKPGSYTIQIPDYQVTVSVSVAPAPWSDLGRALLKAYYYQRASLSLEERYAGAYSRQAGHPDTMIRIHASAASKDRPEGFVFSSPKGWYDAGDYNKYVVNSGISVWTLLALYENYPDYARSLSVNIPESLGSLPDLLAEVRWNLDWMITMQDPGDGGVYHKLTNLRFDPMIMPVECEKERWVVMKTTAAAFHFAATLAQASRVYAPYDSSFAEQCLQQSRRAFAWGMNHPQVPYRQPEDVRTGRYEDERLDDELQWAAYELFLTTQESAFLQIAQSLHHVEYRVPGWQNVGTLGVFSMAARTRDPAAVSQIILLAEQVLAVQQLNAYHIGMMVQDYVWGSNGVVANQGVLLLMAYQLTRDIKYRDAAVHTVDYLLGNNPLRQSFVTGFGSRAPRHPHHRISEADGVMDPIPGLLVGGPNPGRQDGKNCPDYPHSAPALAYLDHLCSYASNEVAINWNAPMVYLVNGLLAD